MSKGSPQARSAAIEAPRALQCQVNNRSVAVHVTPGRTLADMLRQDLGLTGTKIGCDHGQCGACTVLIDGQPRYACLTLALGCEGAAVTTIEGLAQGDELHPVQQAFIECDAYQCGFCTAGQILSLVALLAANAAPDAAAVRGATAGNICRCGAYPQIEAAGLRAAELQRRGSKP